MADYNLNGLNPRDFEHIVQAIAKKEIANGVTPFGDGPDGGREATFSGKMNYPSTTAPWDGFLVIQSKFKFHSNGKPLPIAVKTERRLSVAEGGVGVGELQRASCLRQSALQRAFTGGLT